MSRPGMMPASLSPSQPPAGASTGSSSGRSTLSSCSPAMTPLLPCGSLTTWPTETLRRAASTSALRPTCSSCYRSASYSCSSCRYKLEQKLHTEQVLEDDALALAAGLSSLVPPSLGDVSSTLGGISSSLNHLGTSRVGGLIQQVRTEERSAAKAALQQAILHTKQQLSAKYGQQAGSPQQEQELRQKQEQQ